MTVTIPPGLILSTILPDEDDPNRYIRVEYVLDGKVACGLTPLPPIETVADAYFDLSTELLRQTAMELVDMVEDPTRLSELLDFHRDICLQHPIEKGAT